MIATVLPRTIVVIDDDATHRELVVDALCNAGHRVLAANDVDGGTAILEGERVAPALIVLAWSLPAVRGLELMGALAGDRRWRAVPVVVLADAASGSRVPSHAAAVLSRPPRMRTLLDVVARLSGAAPAPAHVAQRHGRGKPTRAIKKPFIDAHAKTTPHQLRRHGPT
ncbi:MAG TPA: response regulator [Kofleriaceae bacterium]|jgi:CheY-like chemotaxis protein|nr:response regulator [Kofleriaceae bacterium]